MLFCLQFHKTPTMVGLKMFQTVYNRTLCGHSLHGPVLSISKLTYFKWKTITAVTYVNGGEDERRRTLKNNALSKMQFYMLYINFW